MPKTWENAFYYFEKYKDVPFVMVNGKGEYVTEEVAPTEAEIKIASVEEALKPKKKPVHHHTERVSPIKEEDLAKVVDKLPNYPGGNDAFQDFLNRLSKEGMKDLAEGQTKTYIMVDYIIDSVGKPVYAKVIRGGNEDMNEKIEDAFLNMPQWTPANRSGVNVPIRLKQTIMVGTD
jgi:hypothetical protein